MAHKIGILSHPPTEIHSMGSLSGTGVTDDKMASYRHLVHNITYNGLIQFQLGY